MVSADEVAVASISIGGPDGAEKGKFPINLQCSCSTYLLQACTVVLVDAVGLFLHHSLH